MGKIQSIKIIKLWSKLKHPDPRFYKSTIRVFNSMDLKDKQKAIKEMNDFIEYVKSGKYIANKID